MELNWQKFLFHLKNNKCHCGCELYDKDENEKFIYNRKVCPCKNEFEELVFPIQPPRTAGHSSNGDIIVGLED